MGPCLRRNDEQGGCCAPAKPKSLADAPLLRLALRAIVLAARQLLSKCLADSSVCAQVLAKLVSRGTVNAEHMLDLHCHMLPGIDDGAVDLKMAIEMARMAVADGVHTVACTPHIYPGLYENTAAGIRAAVDFLQARLDARGIALQLLVGADVHLEPGLSESIRSGRVPTLAGTRYLLLEPPHHVAPPRFEESVFELMAGGFVPVITHPERLSWIDDHYAMFKRLVERGAWMQLTAASVAGRFGRKPRYWSERMLDDGCVHILASDGHHPDRRPPILSEGRNAAALRVGDEEATHLVLTRPKGIVDDLPPEALPPPPPSATQSKKPAGGFWKRLIGAQ
jgi:protein-tyrosine phosphatase